METEKIELSLAGISALLANYGFKVIAGKEETERCCYATLNRGVYRATAITVTITSGEIPIPCRHVTDSNGCSMRHD